MFTGCIHHGEKGEAGCVLSCGYRKGLCPSSGHLHGTLPIFLSLVEHQINSHYLLSP